MDCLNLGNWKSILWVTTATLHRSGIFVFRSLGDSHVDSEMRDLFPPIQPTLPPLGHACDHGLTLIFMNSTDPFLPPQWTVPLISVSPSVLSHVLLCSQAHKF